MKPFAWNISLALVWAAALGEITLQNLLTGFALGYGILWLTHRLLRSRAYCARLPRFVELLIYFLWEMLLANLRVAYDVITPKHRMRPGIFAFPLQARTEAEITLLSNMITLQPGTVVLDVSEDRRILYIHAMYIDDPEQEKRRLTEGLERRLLNAIR